MALIFTVETGNADPDANSYGAVEDADDYISTLAQSSDWDALVEDDKEKFLVRASRYIDQVVKWNGCRVDQDSGLRWPRAGCYDQDGFEISDDVIPILLQQAVFEFAAYLASGEDYTTPSGTLGFKEIKVDVIDLKMDITHIRASLPDYVIEMLQCLGEVQRGTRPAFKKIVRS